MAALITDTSTESPEFLNISDVRIKNAETLQQYVYTFAYDDLSWTIDLYQNKKSLYDTRFKSNC